VNLSIKTRGRLTAALALLLFGAACSDESARGVSETEIVVGTHQDLTGPKSAWGVPLRDGLKMAIDEVNAAGGVNGRTIRLIVEDTGYDPQRAANAVEKLVSSDNVFAIVAPLGTPTIVPTMPLALQRGALHLFPYTVSEDAFRPFHQLKFAAYPPYETMIRGGVTHFIEEKGARRIGLLFQDDDYGISVRRGLESELEERGMVLSAIENYTRGVTDFSGRINSLHSAGLDLLVIAAVAPDTKAIMEAIKAIGWNVSVLGTQACYLPEVASQGGEAVDGFYAVGQVAIPYPDDPNPLIRGWIRSFEERFGSAANVQALEGYVLGRLFIAGLEAAGRDITPEGFAEALEAMQPFTIRGFGVAPLDFTPSDHLGVKSGFVAQIDAGRWVTVTQTQ
jgi:ABC-type branched-subunit amino acid transport system substrate-binding protein